MIPYSCFAAMIVAITILAPSPDGEAKRPRVLEKMQQVMGELPAGNKTPLDVQIIEETRSARYIRKKLTYQAEPGDRVPAYLLVPTSLQPGQRLPAMLCLHQTTNIGKGEPAGLGGKANLRYAQELAERGFVTLAPDYPSFGDYQYDFARSPHASGSIKAIWNNIRAVDLLQALPEVDGDHIGCIGHSLGGHNGLFTAAFEPRIRAVVSSCGFTSFTKYYGGNLKGWTSPRYMPRIASVYDSRPERVPFDFSDVLSAIAPRAIFVVAPLHDDNFNVDGVRDVAQAIGPVFRGAGARVMPTFRYPDCGHDFPAASRAEVYAWLYETLAPVTRADASIQRWRIAVSETAGIRRFGYPVHARLRLPASIPANAEFRLLDDKVPVAAQFQRLGSAGSAFGILDIDFNVQHAPGETRTYVLESGRGLSAPKRKNGLKVEEKGNRFVVQHGSVLSFGLAKNFSNFLAAVQTPRLEYVKSESPGLWFQMQEGPKRWLGGRGTSEPLIREGPLSTRFFFTGPISAKDPTAGRWDVELSFPSSKSWVECTFEATDAREVTSLGLDLNLVQHKQPVLVDLGAGSLVYAALKPGQEIRLRGGMEPVRNVSGSWSVDIKNGERWEPFVLPDRKQLDRPAEGWAHVMDNLACTAIGVADFDSSGAQTELTIDSQAKVHIQRSVPGKSKKLHFWLHFVDMPIHVGAVTSPQSMMSPLDVRVEPIER